MKVGVNQMTETYVKTNDLRPGIIICEDVYANTNYPILLKNTEISFEHLEILNAFNIRKVKVKEVVVAKTGEAEISEGGTVNASELLASIRIQKIDIDLNYTKAVEDFKKEFQGWYAGTRPDVAKIRSLAIPVIEIFMERKNSLSSLNELSVMKDYTYHHSIAVGILAASICKKMGYPNGQALQLGLAGVLADCGMAKVERAIIDKSAFLTKDEFKEIKKHPVYSYQLIKDTPLLRPEMKQAILQHHERLDGSGYPRGDGMNEISLYSQILAVADVFHAMTSERVYRAKESPYKVIELIKEEEFGKFDLKVVQALDDLVADISIGTIVQLTNGDVGEVMFVHRDARLRPMVKRNTDGVITDLTTNRHIAIDRVLS